ncbi:hypothetical protein AVEN_223971-1 [Araneus ventricosus]|uniref:Uncharacterized protein n=1 Tax=Araneus ventricosus TaxID=182803 RepID=A0A4Y2WJ53_ARAVE|nr:hypothetical protein AVEN_223971-1 [Araneus ventricosus]
MAAKPLFSMMKIFKRRQFQESSTQTDQNKIDAFTQVETNQLFDKSTQTLEVKSDASTQVERNEFDAKFTQTISLIKHDKPVQTPLKISKNKLIQVSPYLFLDKKVQTVNIPNSSQVLVPFKKQKRKTTIPLTTEFLKYLERKYDLQGNNIQFTPEKGVISKSEEHGKETEGNLSSQDGLEIKAPDVGKDLAAQKSSKMSFLQTGHSHEDDLNVFMEDVVSTKNEPDAFKHDYTNGYVKLFEPGEKQNGSSCFKNPFRKMKKLFKN